MIVIFFGTPEFAIPPIEKLIEAGFEIAAVVTEPARPAGRHQETVPSPVKIFAAEKKFTIFEPKSVKAPEWTEKIKTLAPDLLIVAAYGQIMPKTIIEIPRFGCLNIHPSLLPKYRGASPVQFAILNGERETGVTIMLMDEKMDHGPILAQEKIEIGSREDAPSLLERAANLGALMLIPTINDYVNEKIIPQEQRHDEATFSKILKKDDGKIDWQKSAAEIYNQIRAFRPWPGTWSNFRLRNAECRIKILDGKIGDESPDMLKIGDFFVTAGGDLAIKCGVGSLIIKNLVPEGKKEITGIEFIRGYLK